mmetsp:Transcript_1374/g.3056  ORF Transcript_1374/g.3056 Transcript_1374/m.3056 type:complete len:269 (-) Transcript_1374:105-911(-)
MLVDHCVEALLLQQYRYLVDVLDVVYAEHVVGRDVTEIADFLSGGHLEFFLAPAKDHGGRQTKRSQIFDTVLGGFCLLFVRQNRNQADKGEKEIFRAHPELELPQGFQKHARFDVPHGSPHLDETNIGFLSAVVGGGLCGFFDPVLDRIGDVGDDLDRLSQIIPPSFFQNHVAVDLSGGNIVVLRQLEIQESLVVPEIQVRFSSVVQDKDLSVLEGRHCSGVDVQVGVDLDGRHAKPAGLQQAAHAADGNPLPKPTHNTSRHDDILHC